MPGGGWKAYNVELMRFLGILMIMGHHLYHIGFEGAYIFRNCWVWVDFYFILTGAFTYKHFLYKHTGSGQYGSEAIQYTFLKYKKFFLLTTISVIGMYVIAYGNMLIRHEWRLFFETALNAIFEITYLTSSGIASTLNAPLWFLSAMFITLPLIVYLMQAHREFWKVISFLAPILYFGHRGVNTDRTWPNDMIRAFVCIALGTMAYMFAQKIGKCLKGNRILCILASIVEIVMVIASIYISAWNRPCINIMEPLFFLIISLMLSGVTVTSFINNTFVAKLGALSMPIFIFHWVVGSVSVLITESMRTRLLIYYVGTLLISFISLFLLQMERKNYGR